MGRLARTPHSLATSTPTKPPPVTAGAFVFVKSRNQKPRPSAATLEFAVRRCQYFATIGPPKW